MKAHPELTKGNESPVNRQHWTGPVPRGTSRLGHGAGGKESAVTYSSVAISPTYPTAEVGRNEIRARGYSGPFFTTDGRGGLVSSPTWRGW